MVGKELDIPTYTHETQGVLRLRFQLYRLVYQIIDDNSLLVLPISSSFESELFRTKTLIEGSLLQLLNLQENIDTWMLDWSKLKWYRLSTHNFDTNLPDIFNL